MDDGEAEGVASFLALSVRLEKLDLSENQARIGHEQVRGGIHVLVVESLCVVFPA